MSCWRCTSTCLVTTLLTLAIGRPALAAGVAIDSLSPSCAGVGSLVTLTGRGFGAANLRVVVDGVVAQVVAATGSTATFVVPVGVRLGPTTVTATNPGGQTGAREFRICDLLIPGAWAGKWQLTVTYRDAVTHAITKNDIITAFIRPVEPFGVSAMASQINCTGSMSDANFDVHCSGPVTAGLCSINADVRVTVTRANGTLAGVGTSQIVLDPGCGPFASRDDAVQITGVRLSTDAGGSAPPATFLQSFFPQAASLGLLQ